MAEMPLVAYALDVPSPALLVLTMLYRHVPARAVQSYFAGGKPPFAACTMKRLVRCLPRMSKSSIYAHVRTLRDVGAARAATRADRHGFDLLVRERASEATAGGPVPADEVLPIVSGLPEDPLGCRPRRRSDCAAVPRPCPWVSCRYNLYFERHHDVQPHEVDPAWSCALDVAERGEQQVKTIAETLGVTSGRVSQIVHRTAKRLRVLEEQADRTLEDYEIAARLPR